MSILNLEGAHENELVATGEFNLHAPRTAVMLPSGQRVVLPTELLLHAVETHIPATDVALASTQDEVLRARTENASTASMPAVTGERSEDRVIPLTEEQLIVGKREVETGRVRLRRETEEILQTVQVPLTESHWEIEHVTIEQMVDGQPEIRRVGETMIFPLVEERLVVKRELWLKEEVHVRKVSSTVEKSAEFALKRDVLREEHAEAV